MQIDHAHHSARAAPLTDAKLTAVRAIRKESGREPLLPVRHDASAVQRGIGSGEGNVRVYAFIIALLIVSVPLLALARRINAKP